MNPYATSFLLLTLNVLVFVGASVLATVAILSRSRQVKPVKWLYVLVISFCVVAFCTLNVYSENIYEMKVLFMRLRFIGFALLAPSWLLFLADNYSVWSFLKNWKSKIILFAPAVVTIIFSLVPSLHDYMVKDFFALTMHGLELVGFANGLWFPVHFYYSCLLTLISLVLLAQVFLKGSKDLKIQSSLLATGTIVTVGIDLFCVVYRPDLRWMMLSSGTYLLHEATLAYAALRHRLLDPYPVAVERIYLDFPDPVLIFDSTRKLRSFNKAAQSVFDLTDSKLGKSVKEVLGLDQINPGEIKFLIHGKEQFFDLKTDSIEGKLSLTGQIYYFQNVTQRKVIELELQKRLSFKARLMSLISHDVMGNIHSQAKLSKQIHNSASNEIRGVLEVLTNSISNSIEMMDNLIAWSKTQEASFQMMAKPFELNTLLEDVISDSTSPALVKKLNVSFSKRSIPTILTGDSEMLACVFRNLLSNAIRASQTDGLIEISTEVLENQAIVVFQDFGIGMSNEQVQKVYKSVSSDQFWESPSSVESNYSNNTEDKGYGIGLKLAFKFVELHQGKIEIRSYLGVGTWVKVFLPLQIPRS